MKVKNVVFSGFMAAILMSATGTASAAISVASQGYVDAKVNAVSETVSDTYQTKADATTALAGKADKAETLAGYGITDAYTKTESDEKFMILKDATVLGANLQWTADGKLDTKGIASEEGVAALQERVNGTADTAGTVAYDIAAALKAANDYTDTEVKELAEGTVATNTANIATNTADITTLKTGKANVSDVYTKGDVDQKLADYTKTTELDAGFVSENEMTTFKSENTNAIAAAKQAAEATAAAALNAYKGTNDAAVQKNATDIKTNADAIADINADLATMATSETVTALTTRVGTAESDIDALQAKDTELAADIATNAGAIADNKSAIEQIEAAYIAKPAACQNTYCVLSVNGETISWMPLTEPVENFIGE